jgi:AbrB family looped-hinge helix DNA binding protein
LKEIRVSKVTRKGQITIPSEFRARHKIVKGSVVQLTDEGSRLIIEPVPDLLDLAGADAGKYAPHELKRMLDESRERWR